MNKLTTLASNGEINLDQNKENISLEEDDVNGTTRSSNSEEKDEANFTLTTEASQTKENGLDEDDICKFSNQQH